MTHGKRRKLLVTLSAVYDDEPLLMVRGANEAQVHSEMCEGK